jgi:hypothetical protein
MNLQKVTLKHPFLRKAARLCIASTIIAVTLQPVNLQGITPTALAAAAPTLSAPAWVNTKNEPITSGAALHNYVWSGLRGAKEVHSDVSVVDIDLQNPYVRLDVMTGQNNQFTKKQSVRGMATETGAVAGVNGDFFNTQAEGVPLGAEIAQGKLMSTPQLNTPGYYNFAITQDNKPIVDLFTFKGEIHTQDGAVYPLDGVNKSYYWYEQPIVRHSHDNSMFIYTDTWAQTGRAVDRNTDLIEVLIVNNIITQIADRGALDVIPPTNGYILRTEGAGAAFVKQHMKVGDPIAAYYGIEPQDPSKVYDTKNFKMLISGGTILVDNGQPTAFSRDSAELGGYRSRTGIGYSKDEKHAYLITVDASGDSGGASLSEFERIMVLAGIWKGMNLDGGGSTQMVERPLGSTNVQLVNQTENGNERQIVNGLGVYSSAPKGTLKGLTLQGPTAVFLNENVTFTAKGYDEYYNPIEVPADIKWTNTNGSGTFEQNIFTAKKPGTTTLTATAGGITQSMNITVLGKDSIKSLTIVPSMAYLSEGQTIQLSVKAMTKTGMGRTIPVTGLSVEISGFKGELTGDQLHVTSLAGSTMGQIILHYDGFSSMLTLPVGQKKLWADFSNLTYPMTFTSSAPEVTGSVYNVNNEMHLKYDFTQGTGTKAAYAAFGDLSRGIPASGEPQKMGIRVNGDNSLNMLRAELIDADGDINRVDLATSVNWTGWKTLEADLTSLHLSYPFAVKRIYVASPELGQDERAKVGEIDFDDITFLNKGDLPQLPKNQIKLTINKKTVVVNGKNMTIDQAPVIVNGTTLVPVRFVTEQLGGSVTWDDKAKKVSILRGSQLIDFWLGDTEFICNGSIASALAAPTLLNGRTMVPLRVLSDKLGWKITWDEKNRTVLLQ